MSRWRCAVWKKTKIIVERRKKKKSELNIIYIYIKLRKKYDASVRVHTLMMLLLRPCACVFMSVDYTTQNRDGRASAAPWRVQVSGGGGGGRDSSSSVISGAAG